MNELVARLPESARNTQVQLRRLWRLVNVVRHILHGFVLALVHRAWVNPHRERIRQVAQQWLRDLLAILSVEVKVHGRLPRETVFMVSNHVSWLDIPVVGAVHGVHFLSKAEVREWPLIGALAAAAGTLFIRRGSGDSRQKSAEIVGHLIDGRPVLIFPEGTTTDGTRLGRFHSRLFDAPLQAGTPVQPVTVRYLDDDGNIDPTLAFIGDDAFHTHLWQLLLRDRVQVELVFAEPLTMCASLERDLLCQSARERVALALS